MRDKERFLQVFRQLGIVQGACDATGVPRSSVYTWRDRDAAFKARFDEAAVESTERLEAEARRRGCEGWLEPVLWRGALVIVGYDKAGNVVAHDDPAAVSVKPLMKRVVSDGLIMFLLKMRHPEYRDRGNLTAAHDDQDGPILILSDP